VALRARSLILNSSFEILHSLASNEKGGLSAALRVSALRDRYSPSVRVPPIVVVPCVLVRKCFYGE